MGEQFDYRSHPAATATHIPDEAEIEAVEDTEDDEESDVTDEDGKIKLSAPGEPLPS